MRTINRSVWLTLLFVSMLTLAACVRPYPQDKPAETSEQDRSDNPSAFPEVTPIATAGGTAVPVPTLLPVEPTAEIPPTAEPPTEQIHTVEAGDTLFQIASQYGVTIEVITSVNDIPNINQLEVGQQLIIPGPNYVPPTATPEIVEGDSTSPPEEAATDVPQVADGTHVVQPGENLFRIGLTYGCSVEQMAAHNGIVNPAAISVGQVLNIPEC